MDLIRTRFAPSPTGFLHIGNLRTALFAYLVAKSSHGKLLLRIEDTDQKREVAGAVDGLLKIFDWLGLYFDEGPHVGGSHGPYVQSQRQEIYNKYADQLLQTGQAYRCFCTPEKLEKMRLEQQEKKMPPRYDQACRQLDLVEVNKKLKNNEPFVIRQKMPKQADVRVYDELRGEIIFKSKDLDDHVLIKSNGIPTYQFAVVIDDHTMGITHVFRGEDWISSFPKNVLLYKDFGWDPPKFIHLPLILNKTGGKLSKRQGDTSVEDFKNKGYLPEALINFSALLGWHPKSDKEIMSLEEIIAKFKIQDIGVSGAIFDADKLNYLNGHYIREKNLDDLALLCRPYLEEYWQEKGLTVPKDLKTTKYLKSIVALEQERMKKLSQIGELTEFFFLDNLEYPVSRLVWKKMDSKNLKPNLEKIITLISNIPDDNWTKESIEEAVATYLKVKELKIGEYLWPMRVALTGREASPSPFEVAEVLGKKESRKRINQAISKL